MEKLSNFSFLEDSGNYLLTGLVKDNKLVEFYIFDKKKKSIAGNIYRARLLNKINVLNGFFVDIGEEKNGLLQLDEENFSKFKETDELILQVTYDGNDHKGPKLTDKYEIKGEFFILTPFDMKIKLSKKFTDRDKGLQIKNKFKELSNDLGFIIRTSAESASLDELENEFFQLLETYKYLEKEKNFSPTPKLLYSKDYVLESLTFEKDLMFVSNVEASIEKYKTKNISENIIYDSDFSIKKQAGIFAQVKNLFNRNFILENGIELVFDKTEAFHVIDINSKGFFNPGKDLAKDTNNNCVKEIINQIHLRNICGIILVDFISYTNKEDEKKLLNYFFNESKKYKNPINVIGFTKLGILELTRNKNVNHLSLDSLDLSII